LPDSASTSLSDSSGYVLVGYAEIEHDRLIRQAQRLQVCTETFFRESGIGAGLRVLDLGSGIGDVAMLAARIVGPAGEVVGVERDPDRCC
jgi:ubiquinone/menaquinone biosynthesis C-methylase UbiE